MARLARSYPLSPRGAGLGGLTGSGVRVTPMSGPRRELQRHASAASLQARRQQKRPLERPDPAHIPLTALTVIELVMVYSRSP
jgi:hypothetical protein